MVGAAFLFPGQGSQGVGMGRLLNERYPEARRVFDAGDRILGFALSSLCFEGPLDELTRTENTQPALLVTSIAAFRVLEAKGLKPSAAAGHSAGEFAAHVAAGSLTFEEGLTLIRRRGEAMAGAGKERPGSMAAVLGLSMEQVEAVLGNVNAPRDIAVANYNTPGQVVLSGTTEALERATEEAMRAGAKKVVPLQVGAAFHSPLMEAASRGFNQAIARATIVQARFPVYANVTAAPASAPDVIRETLERQLLSPVRWEQTTRAMVQAGIRHFVEVGNGRVLRGLVRGIDREVVLYGSEDPDSIETTAAALAETAAR